MRTPGREVFVAVGQSMGGKLAQFLPVADPSRVEGLVLIAPAPAGELPTPDFVRDWVPGLASEAVARGPSARHGRLSARMTYRLLLDTSSLMFRAFFSMPTSVAGTDGQPVNALHGYLDMTAGLIRSRRPDECVHCYDDDWRPAPRVAEYAGYKANRPPDPEPLPEQFVILRRILDALGLPQAEAPGWEAEDAIGSLCAGARRGDRMDIVTGDRDLLQLVRDPAVRVLFTLRGVSNLHEFDEAAVLEKYGVPASRYAEFAMLRGDPSDGLPGVRGVGEKTARLLVQTYPSLEALVADASAVRRTGRPLQRSSSLRSSIRDAAEYLEAMRRVVPIRTDLEVRAWQNPADPNALQDLAEHHRLTGPIRRLTASLAGPRP